jgi:hypothetical protein
MDSPVKNIQPARIFQYKIFSQHGYSSTIYSVSMDIPVQNIQSETFQHNTFSKHGFSCTKDSVRIDIPAQNIQSAWIFQYKIFSQCG